MRIFADGKDFALDLATLPLIRGKSGDTANLTAPQIRSWAGCNNLQDVPKTEYPQYGTLIVLPDGGFDNGADGFQLFCSPNGTMWTRNYDEGGVWHDWKRILTTDDLNK